MSPAPENESNERLSETAQARAAIYGLLGRVFSAKPSCELLKGLKDKQMLDALAAFEVVLEPDFIAGEEKQQAGELAAEYTRLFLGPGPHIAPYESVFIPGEGEESPRLWGEATREVAKFFEEAGLELGEGETPDHISLEFGAIAVLAQEEAEKRESGDSEEADRLREMQLRFCSEHPARWVPELSRAVADSTRSGFYRSMVLLAENVVRMHCGGK